MTTVVFRRRAHASDAGPAREGDLLAASHRGARCVVLLDHDRPAPWPEELLAVRARGVRVIAAGAAVLRAWELRDWAVEGAGELYARAATLADDQLYFPHEAAPDDAWLAVDVEEAVSALALDPRIVARHRAQRPAARSLRTALEVLPPAERAATWARVSNHVRLSERDGDAALLAANSPAPDVPVPRAPWRPLHVDRLEHDAWRRTQLAPEHPSGEALTRAGETYAVTRKKILLRLLARDVARHRGLAPSDEEVEAFARDWRRQWGFVRASDLQQFLGEAGVSVAELYQTLSDFVLITRLEAAYDAEIRALMHPHVVIQAARTRTP
jgi:hypothetical protein